MRLHLNEKIWKEGNVYVSYCPELEIASCGETVEQAKKNLKAVVQINIEETKKKGLFRRFLEEAEFDLTQRDDLTQGKELIAFEPFEIAV